MNLPERLRALPEYEPPSGGWEQLSARLDARRRGWFAAGGGLALAASVLVAVGLAGLKPLSQNATPQPAAVASASDAQVAQLIRASQRLENKLRQVRPQVAVWNTTRAQRAALIEGQLSRLDAQLSYADDDDEARRLWNQRVRLMNALVELHQNQAPALQYASYQY